LFSGLQKKDAQASPAKEEQPAPKKDLYGGFIDLNNIGQKEEDD